MNTPQLGIGMTSPRTRTRMVDRLREKGIATVLVTNGMFSEALLDDLSPWVAAANVEAMRRCLGACVAA